VNCLNTGQIPGLPLGCCVETLGTVDGLGVRPVFAVAGLGLPLLAAGFARRLARRGAPTG